MKKIFYAIIFFTLLTVVSFGQSYSYPTNATLLWQTQLNADALTEPAIAPNGTIYVNQYTVDAQYQSAFNTNGGLMWRTNYSAPYPGALVSGVDGSLYFAGPSGAY